MMAVALLFLQVLGPLLGHSVLLHPLHGRPRHALRLRRRQLAAPRGGAGGHWITDGFLLGSHVSFQGDLSAAECSGGGGCRQRGVGWGLQLELVRGGVVGGMPMLPGCTAGRNRMLNTTSVVVTCPPCCRYLIAVGTGGIKPCVSTFGADQVRC